VEKLLQPPNHNDEFELSAQWIEDARQRCKELEDGAAAMIPAEDVFEEANEFLEKKR